MLRVVACVLVLAGLSLGLSGCTLFNKKGNRGGEGDRAPFASKAKAKAEPAKFPGSGDPIKGGTTTAAPDSADPTGLLAGAVIDAYNNHPKGAFVQWVDLDESKQGEAPIDVEVSPEGYFTIRGLKANHHYKLTARAKDGSRMLAGVTYTKAPNPRIVIRVTEDNANSGTPPIPGPPAYNRGSGQGGGPKKDEPKKTGENEADKPAAAQPGWGPVTPANAVVGAGSGNGNAIPDLPAKVKIPTPVANPPPSQGWMPGVASNVPSWPPVLDTSGLRKNPSGTGVWIEKPMAIQDWPTSPPIKSGPSVSTTRVPSCVLVGKQLVNLALYDPSHQPWEFKSQRRGKLVLFDFWGTWCVPCLEAIPHLRILQSQYGGAGLEVVGIAYEKEDTFEEQARHVSAAAQRRQINYRLLLGGGSHCPVQTSFNVRLFPTLILVDENGWVIWRHPGRPDRVQLDELELIIKRRLGL